MYQYHTRNYPKVDFCRVRDAVFIWRTISEIMERKHNKHPQIDNRKGSEMCNVSKTILFSIRFVYLLIAYASSDEFSKTVLSLRRLSLSPVTLSWGHNTYHMVVSCRMMNYLYKLATRGKHKGVTRTGTTISNYLTESAQAHPFLFRVSLNITACFWRISRQSLNTDFGWGCAEH